jgi:hypothetical protein
MQLVINKNARFSADRMCDGGIVQDEPKHRKPDTNLTQRMRLHFARIRSSGPLIQPLLSLPSLIL